MSVNRPPRKHHRLKGFALTCRIVLILAGLALVFAGFQLLPFRSLLITLIGVGMVRKCWQNRPRASSAFGTARLADFFDMACFGLIYGSRGILLGRAGDQPRPTVKQRLRALLTWPLSASLEACLFFLSSRRQLRNALIRLNIVHVLVVAPPGRGKSRYVAAPLLLDCIEMPAFVLDVKGELHGICASHRQRRSGRKSRVISTFGSTGEAPIDTINPLDTVDPKSPNAMDDCFALADAMIVRQPGTKEPHWDEQAALVVAAIMACVVFTSPPAERNLQTVRDTLASSKSFNLALAGMEKLNAGDGMLRRLSQQLQQISEKEMQSIMSTITRQLRFLDSPSIKRVTMRSTFDIRELIDGTSDVYLTVSPDQITSQAGFIRLIATCVYRTQIRYGSANTPVLYVLDEIGNCGHLEAIEHALTVGRSYGAKLCMFLQSQEQLSFCFPDKAGVALSCFDTQLYFGLNDVQTADAVAKRLGSSTIFSHNYQQAGGFSQTLNYGSQGSATYTANWSSGTAEVARPVLFLDEIIRLPDRRAILCHRNLPPAVIELIPFDEAPELFAHDADRVPPGHIFTVAFYTTFMAITAIFCCFAVDGLARQSTTPARPGVQYSRPQSPPPGRNPRLPKTLPLSERRPPRR